jgi:predicted  nucleic acid-binding Zn-ribbon protein
VNPELRNLIALQDLELKSAELQKQLSDIPLQIQNLNEELERLTSAHEERVATAKELANRKRTLEGQVDMLQTKLARLKDQLMTVKTNKEYTAMLHEIQTAEGLIREEEDKILEVMEEMDARDRDLESAEAEMRTQSAGLREVIRTTGDSIPGLEQQLARLKEEREAVAALIDGELLARYRQIAGARKGVAMAEARDELCSCCHVRIRPQMYADLLRTDAILYCDSCSRILFTREEA